MQPLSAAPPPGSQAAPSEDPRVAQALQDYLAALQHGRAPDRAEYLARHADIADALAPALDGLEVLHGAAVQLHDLAGPALADAPGAGEPAGQPLGDFRIVREVGRGGMGVVYEAEQLSLGRRVALKVLPFAAALEPKHLRRFQVEAQAAAGLHHPHIVPVHAVGCERGMHYYAMQFIEGRSLAAVIAEIRNPKPETRNKSQSQIAKLETQEQAGAQTRADLGNSDLELVSDFELRISDFCRKVARLGVQAAEALAYAHDQDVIHRDVKPANLLLDHAGQLWLTDFGLARLPNAATLTVSGDLVGTLRYMSPEQAQGRREEIDHRTDIYSLGTTLYELLTRTPAFPGDDRQDVMRRVADEEPTPPRRLNAAVPHDLETIVLKAMAKEPAERYGTAQEVADDLQRFLECRPVLAHRPSLLHRGRKWARRHWAALTILAAGLLVGMAGGVVTLWLAYRTEGTRRQQAELQRQRLTARAAGRNIGAAEDIFRTTPRLNPDQRRVLAGVLADSLDLLETLRREDVTDPELRRQIGVAYLRLGHVRGWLNQGTECVAAYRQSLALFKDLAEEFPGDRDHRYSVFYLASTLASAVTTHSEEQSRLRREARAVLEQLAREDPPNPTYRDALANVYMLSGNDCLQAEQLGDAERFYRQGLDVVEPLVRERPDWPDYARNLAGNLYRLGWLLHQTGRAAEAGPLFRRAVETGKLVLASAPDVAAYRREMTDYLLGWAEARIQGGSLADVAALLDEARRLTARLREDYPDMTHIWWTLEATILWQRHEFLKADRRPEEAREAYRAHVSVLVALTEVAPVNDYHLATAARALADDPYPDLRDLDRALPLAREAVRLGPHEPYNAWALGLVHARRGDWPASLQALEGLGDAPRPDSVRGWLLRATVQWHLGRHADARRTYEQTARYLAARPYVDGAVRHEQAETAKLLEIAGPP